MSTWEEQVKKKHPAEIILQAWTRVMQLLRITSNESTPETIDEQDIASVQWRRPFFTLRWPEKTVARREFIERDPELDSKSMAALGNGAMNHRIPAVSRIVRDKRGRRTLNSIRLEWINSGFWSLRSGCRTESWKTLISHHWNGSLKQVLALVRVLQALVTGPYWFISFLLHPIVFLTKYAANPRRCQQDFPVFSNLQLFFVQFPLNCSISRVYVNFFTVSLNRGFTFPFSETFLTKYSAIFSTICVTELIYPHIFLGSHPTILTRLEIEIQQGCFLWWTHNVSMISRVCFITTCKSQSAAKRSCPSLVIL